MSLASDPKGGSKFDNVKHKNVFARIRYELLRADKIIGKEVWKAWESRRSPEKVLKQTSRVAPKSVEDFLLWRVEDAQVE
jgi:hypothetical protein